MIRLLVVAILVQNAMSARMDVVHSWKTVDFTFPSPAAREAMIRSGHFIPGNVAPIDVDVWEGPSLPSKSIQTCIEWPPLIDERANKIGLDRKRCGNGYQGQGQKVFITMPRFKAGTPATLATVGISGLLTPYPDWSWHREGDCDGITSVFRVDIDHCGRLWVIDSGTVNIFEKDAKMICPPQILVFNLYNDKLIGRYKFPDQVLEPKSLLITIAVDARGPKCEDTFAYVADVVGYRLLVYDANEQTSWRATNNYFYPYPLYGSFSINNVDFDLMDGVLGLALGPLTGTDRRLYFHSLASVRESWVATSILRNASHFLEGDGAARSFKVSQYSRPSQSAAEAMSPSGVLFFGLLSSNSIACWNSRLSYTSDNIITVAKDDVRLQFSSGVKIRNGFLWILSNRFQNFIADVLDTRETNYRLSTASLPVLTHGTSCHYPSDGYVQSTTYRRRVPFLSLGPLLAQSAFNRTFVAYKNKAVFYSI